MSAMILTALPVSGRRGPRGPLSQEEKDRRNAKRKATLTQKKKEEEERNARESWERSYRDARNRVKTEPTKLFKPGDRLSLGCIDDVRVLEVLDDGKVYVIQKTHKQKKQHTRVEYTTVEKDHIPWQDAHPYIPIDQQPPSLQPKRIQGRLSYSQMHLSSIVHSNYYYFGIDMNPSYQRDLVWEPEQKVALIHSIFTNVDIGKFLFAHNGYNRGDVPMYEIIDGKQRVTALVEFFENRFTYRGLTFDDLCNQDKYHFTDYPVAMAELRDPSLEEKMYYFLNVNTGGKPVDPNHLMKVEKDLEKLREQKDECGECNEKFTEKDIDGGRCLSCGTMITHKELNECENEQSAQD